MARDDQVSAKAMPRCPFCRRRLSSCNRRTIAAAKSSIRSGATIAPDRGSRTERVPSAAVETTGVPCAMASSSTSPWVSVREAKRKACAAA